MSEAEIRIAVTSFFADRGKPATEDDVDIFETEYIDSMELLELIMHLEEVLKIGIDQDLMSVDNFRSVGQIIRTVGKSTD
jgi:acyl carrier protein